MPTTPPSANMAIVEEPLLTADIENTDTTASDTDQSGPQHHAINQEARMEDTSFKNSV